MKRTIIGLALALATTSAAYAQVSSNAQTDTRSDAGAVAYTGNTTFEASEQRGSINTTPSAYVPPSMFGGASNCGMSDTLALGFTGASGGFSKSKESVSCNARMDTQTAYNLGYKEVAAMRFFCFGIDENRQAFEALGNKCPATATAKASEPVALATSRGQGPFSNDRVLP